MTPTNRPLTAEQAASLTAVTEPWLSCDDCFEQIDSFVDALVTRRARLDEPLRVHLARCPACLEEAESLISLVAEAESADVESLLASFDADVTRST
ncbi:MAG: hypothetical protein R2698_03540 [Microthrixaceae bacterium]